MEISSDIHWHELKENELLKKLDASQNGLKESEAASRLATFGYNELQKKKGVSKRTDCQPATAARGRLPPWRVPRQPISGREARPSCFAAKLP